MEEQAHSARAGRRRQIYVRAGVFVGLACFGEVLGVLPPGPARPAAYWASLVVLVAVAAAALLPSTRFPCWAVLIPTLAYLVSVTLLLISGGDKLSAQNTAGGLSALVLLPVLAMALYFPPLHSVVAIVGATVSIAVAGVADGLSAASDIRRVLLWMALLVVMAVTIHRLRHSLEGEVRESAELARLGRLMNGATQSLTSLRDPKDVIAEGAKVMTQMAGAGFTRAAYVRVRDEVVLEEVVVDDAADAPRTCLLRDDPYVRQVVETGQALVTRLDPAVMGPTLRAPVEDLGITSSALLPIAPNGELHGIMTVDSRGLPISEEVFSRCRALANVIELALANALAHQELEIQANTDPLTGLANRRGLALYLEGDRRHEPLAILVLDIDDLKDINDAHGHDVGDTILIAVARAVSGSLRGGGLLARTGGDEFVAIVADADESDARLVAERITEAVGRVRVQGVRTSVSIGFACSGKNGDIDRARQLADEAMYEAKRVARHHQERRTAAKRAGGAAGESTDGDAGNGGNATDIAGDGQRSLPPAAPVAGEARRG
jgi:diguanylate cyclase (GGDEF)-like protein